MAGRRKRKSRGGYRMTPDRKDALRKAQMASARKRHRKAKVKQAGRIAGGIVATAVVGAAAYHLNDGARHPVKKSREIKKNATAVYKYGKNIKNRGKSNPSTAAKAASPAHWGGNGYL